MVIFRTPFRQHMSDVDLTIHLSIVVGVDGYEVGGLGESIHVHPNRVKLADSQWQSHNEAHANVITLSFWNAQRLQQYSRLQIVSLDFPTGITL
jgi:hypothetical protein